jgi:hypothetical protein
MKISMDRKNVLPLLLIAAGFALASVPGARGQPAAAATNGLVPLLIKLPDPSFVITPRDPTPGSDVEPVSKEPRPPLMVPKDVKNIAPSAKITCSDPNATPDALGKITDGNKEAVDSNIVLLRKGAQWVQFDLGAEQEIYAIVVWHAHDAPKVYHGVVIQVSDDAGFTNNVTTLFNNDVANKAGRGAGTDREYVETNQGKLIDAKGIKARYARLYSSGNTEGVMNEYTEVEIYARPAK